MHNRQENVCKEGEHLLGSGYEETKRKGGEGSRDEETQSPDIKLNGGCK